MTREEMCKKHWKPYSIIHYQEERMLHPVECLLSGIDFDAELMILTPVDEFYDQREFPANIKYCSIPPKKLTAVTYNGKRIETEFPKIDKKWPITQK